MNQKYKIISGKIQTLRMGKYVLKQYIRQMLDKDLMAHTIGIIKRNNTVSPLQLSNELEISQFKALELLEQLEEYDFIVRFEGFFACVDFAELN